MILPRRTPSSRQLRGDENDRHDDDRRWAAVPGCNGDTLFALTMAALMIPGSKLTDIWGRKR